MLFSVGGILLSCVKEPTTESISNLSFTEQTTTSFTAQLTGKVDNYTPRELSLGEIGIIYCEENDVTESLFEAWKNGDDSLSVSKVKGKITNKTDYQFNIEGLKPSTQYNCCMYFRSEEGSIKEISDLMMIVTKAFVPQPSIDVQNIDIFSSSFHGNVQIDKTDMKFCSFGIYLSNNSNVNSSQEVKKDNISSLGDFDVEWDFIQPDTDYEVFSYVTNNVTNDTIKSKNVKFKTLSPEIMLVDLGLPSGILWSDRDLGTKEKKEGQYAEPGRRPGFKFKWGEITPSTNGDKYSLLDINGTYQNIGNDISGTKYDVVHVIMGGKWRMPNRKDVEELVSYAKCSIVPRISNNGITDWGYVKLSNPENSSNSIFFTEGTWWISEIAQEDYSMSYIFDYSGTDGTLSMQAPFDSRDRIYSFTVRPIWDPNM